MAEGGKPQPIQAAGEYGATTVSVTRDGSNTRIAFGRNGDGGSKVYYGAMILSPEAVLELKEQLAHLES